MNEIASLPHAMSVLEEIRRELAKSTDLEKIQDLRDQAESIRHYIKTAAWGLEMQNRAGAVKLLCERRIGQILEGLLCRGGDRKSADQEVFVTLKDLGISRIQSSRWQREGSLPEEEFDQYVKQAKKEGRELTSNGLLRLAKLHVGSAQSNNNGTEPFHHLLNGIQRIVAKHECFASIYADPPWSHIKKSESAKIYRKLCSLPVKLVSAQQAHLHIRVPPELMEAGLALLRAWGFRYKAALVRRIASRQYGDYWRQEHDVLLLGVRGRLPFRDRGLPSWLDARDDSLTNSSCEVCALIARVSPPPYLDLFATAGCAGWTTIAQS
jgi:hypothetical protein